MKNPVFTLHVFLQCDKNEELSIELLNLVNQKAALMKQLAILTNGDKYKAGDADAEISRVKAIVIQNSSGKVKVDEILGTQQDRASVEEAVGLLFFSVQK